MEGEVISVMEGEVISGEQFNIVYKGKLFVKLTNHCELHNGYQFKTGLNVDTVLFNPSGECNPGGIYFCEFNEIPYWLRYNGSGPMVWYRYVSVPADSKVYIEMGKFKVDKLILTDRALIVDIMTEDKWVTAARHNIGVLKDMKDQTERICLAAVLQYGNALEYVEDQTERICLAAVLQDCYALEYVKNQTDAICLAAVQQNGYALEYVKTQTDAICLAAVQQNGYALEYVKNQTDAICLAAVQQNGYALRYVRDQMKRISLADVLQRGGYAKDIYRMCHKIKLE
jgi:hypothetical protein